MGAIVPQNSLTAVKLCPILFLGCPLALHDFRLYLLLVGEEQKQGSCVPHIWGCWIRSLRCPLEEQEDRQEEQGQEEEEKEEEQEHRQEQGQEEEQEHRQEEEQEHRMDLEHEKDFEAHAAPTDLEVTVLCVWRFERPLMGLHDRTRGQ